MLDRKLTASECNPACTFLFDHRRREPSGSLVSISSCNKNSTVIVVVGSFTSLYKASSHSLTKRNDASMICWQLQTRYHFQCLCYHVHKGICFNVLLTFISLFKGALALEGKVPCAHSPFMRIPASLQIYLCGIHSCNSGTVPIKADQG